MVAHRTTNYASYGWWLHTDADGDLIASAFHDYRGADALHVEHRRLAGNRHVHGRGSRSVRSPQFLPVERTTPAASPRTLSSTPPSLRDHTISGTINNFVGADGEARDWSVALNEADIGDTGVIDGPVRPMTSRSGRSGPSVAWPLTLDGQWSGTLREQGDDGVPTIATGTFHSMFGADGQMVGAFGANKDD